MVTVEKKIEMKSIYAECCIDRKDYIKFYEFGDGACVVKGRFGGCETEEVVALTKDDARKIGEALIEWANQKED